MSENGTMYNFGDTINIPLSGITSTDNAHIVGFQTPASNFDFWAAGTHGSVYTAPSGAGAQSYGSLSCSAPCVAAIAASFEGLGYYLAGAGIVVGSVFPFGDAPYYHDVSWDCSNGANTNVINCFYNIYLGSPISAIAVSPSYE